MDVDPPKKRIYYGSLEDVERARIEAGINVGVEEKGKTLDELEEEDNYEYDESTKIAKAEQQAILDEFERKKKARNIAVPTDDKKVRLRLRELGEPITLFGEGPAERRDRLREHLSRLSGEEIEMEKEQEEEEKEKEKEEKEVAEEFYTIGTKNLLDARRYITLYSLKRAHTRLEEQRQELMIPIPQRKKLRHDLYSDLKKYTILSSQIGEDRPLPYITVSPNSQYICTASYSGLVKLFKIPTLENCFTFKGHKERLSGLAWHPQATLSMSTSSVNLASCSADGAIHLWSLESDIPLAKLEGHNARVARVAFHPSGRFLGSASFDGSWRLFDIDTTEELLLQEGHSREVYAIDFQCDGSLVATGGLDSIGRVWDLRSGRSIMILLGHVNNILSIDWSPNGYQVATGSADNTIKIWDIRQGKTLKTIPAHTNLVSQVRYWHANLEDSDPEKIHGHDIYDAAEAQGPKDVEMTDADSNSKVEAQRKKLEIAEVYLEDEERYRKKYLSGSYLVSSSYDQTIKIWSEGDYKLLRTLPGHENKIMCMDVSQDGRYIVSSSYDRTFKLWASEDLEY
ncbi:WD40 repeat-like protein [Neocallimastix lanati (nom. inval.)]|jgi:U4/U6 small nuclear ribonucleoprotein PRP4|uniref:WD40 repeat-like protein n=1 Tax=Neocallimastix californiae TaxID=1754190 RepID=A0A1Y2C6A8_9FUNG|nr:WD40 repeat-like protein [Neocallimastix sp. JGI-2020a]ORY42414.1 WD40 repeat-like protein [Neocallimastix californiae]|eukprot:ORY42414.1 WD40 repeat-like protein [Neocallimastix californiae]